MNVKPTNVRLDSDDVWAINRVERMEDNIIAKAWRLVDSCQTNKQARGAIKYLELLAEAYPEIDVSPMRKELQTLFDFKEPA